MPGEAQAVRCIRARFAEAQWNSSRDSVPLDGYMAVRASIEARFSRPGASDASAACANRCSSSHHGGFQGVMTRERQQDAGSGELAGCNNPACQGLRAAGSMPPTLSVAETTDTNSDGAPDEFEASAAAEQMLGGLSQSFTRVKAPQVRAQSPLPFPSMASCSPTISRRSESQRRLQPPSVAAAAAASPRCSSKPQRLRAELLSETRQSAQKQSTHRATPNDVAKEASSRYINEADVFCPLSPNSALGSLTPTNVSGCGGTLLRANGPPAQAASSLGASKRRPFFYGPTCNHSPFLEGRALQALLPFLFGPSLAACMGVCVHWFMSISDGLADMCSPLSRDFEAAYGKYLLPLNATLKVQPLQTADGSGARLDWVIAAKVLPSASNKVLSLGYCFEYRSQPSRLPDKSVSTEYAERDLHASSSARWADGASSRRSVSRGRLDEEPPSPSFICSPDRSTAGSLLRSLNHVYLRLCWRGYQAGSSASHARREVPTFSVAVAPAGTKRRLWLHRDLCRFHGDETGQAVLTPLGPVCVGDLVEVPVVLSNGIGLADLSSVKWLTLHCVPRVPRVLSGPKAFEAVSLGVYEGCGLEMQYLEWFDGDQYRHMTTERLKRPECMEPELQHLSTSYTGIDVLVRRSIYRAVRTGTIGAKAQRAWGLQCQVLPAETSVVFSLTRKGLQHDRSTCLQLRKGDILESYMTVGGANI
ncbi:hypothetical protein Emag_003152 [Eimeria magna]